MANEFDVDAEDLREIFHEEIRPLVFGNVEPYPAGERPVMVQLGVSWQQASHTPWSPSPTGTADTWARSAPTTFASSPPLRRHHAGPPPRVRRADLAGHIRLVRYGPREARAHWGATRPPSRHRRPPRADAAQGLAGGVGGSDHGPHLGPLACAASRGGRQPLMAVAMSSRGLGKTSPGAAWPAPRPGTPGPTRSRWPPPRRPWAARVVSPAGSGCSRPGSRRARWGLLSPCLRR
ncbi:hypothetical protein ABH917_001062 [Thermobifida halotolerans]